MALAAWFQDDGADSAFDVFAAIRNLAGGRRQEQLGTEWAALPEETSHLGKEAHPFTRSYLLSQFNPHPFPAGSSEKAGRHADSGSGSIRRIPRNCGEFRGIVGQKNRNDSKKIVIRRQNHVITQQKLAIRRQ